MIPRDVVLNNCLDPFAPEKSHWKVHTMTQERDLVLEISAPWVSPGTKVWGYVTTGGTEGNLKGLRTGLEKHPHKKKLVLLGNDAHFSVEKAARSSGAQYVKINSKANGQMDLEDMNKVVEIAKRCGVEQLVIMASLGTTFKGASDDLPAIIDYTSEFYSRGDVFIHLDGAFNGGFWHHDDNAPKYELGEEFDSFSVSGHKFYGGFIAGCFFTKEDTLVKSTKVSYLGMEDKIASGSRNGYQPILWLARLRQFDWKQEYLSARENLKYLEDRFAKLNVPTFSHPVSLITIFPEPSSAVCDYFQLATVDDWAHVCMMPHVTKQDIDHFIDTLVEVGDIQKMANQKYKLDPVTGWPLPSDI